VCVCVCVVCVCVCVCMCVCVCVVCVGVCVCVVRGVCVCVCVWCVWVCVCVCGVRGVCVCVCVWVYVCLWVGIADRYGLEGPGIESQYWRYFPHPSRPSQGHTQSPAQSVPSFAGAKRPRRGADHPPHLTPRLQKG